jgi:cytochrome c556
MTRRDWGIGIIAFMVISLLIASASPRVLEATAEEFPKPGASDPREVLDLTPAQKETLKATMHEHLAAVEAIVAALARQDYEKAADVAHFELGFPKHREVMQHEAGAALPKKYMELALEHHQAAEDLAEAITSKEMTRILEQLAKTIQACTTCHKAYKL